MAVPSDSIDFTLKLFNFFHTRLQFSIEVEKGNKINFLNVTLISNNNRIIFDWFHKTIFSGQYLKFPPQHPICQKIGIIIGLVDRTLLFNPKFHHKNIVFIINILINNNYSLEFIFNNNNKR